MIKWIETHTQSIFENRFIDNEETLVIYEDKETGKCRVNQCAREDFIKIESIPQNFAHLDLAKSWCKSQIKAMKTFKELSPLLLKQHLAEYPTLKKPLSEPS